MPTDKKSTIYISALEEIKSKISNFKKILDEGTKDPQNFITFDEIEKELGKLNSESKKIYKDLLSNYLSNIDETKIINLKKKNTKTEKYC